MDVHRIIQSDIKPDIQSDIKPDIQSDTKFLMSAANNKTFLAQLNDQTRVVNQILCHLFMFAKQK